MARAMASLVMSLLVLSLALAVMTRADTGANNKNINNGNGNNNNNNGNDNKNINNGNNNNNNNNGNNNDNNNNGDNNNNNNNGDNGKNGGGTTAHPPPPPSEDNSNNGEGTRTHPPPPPSNDNNDDNGNNGGGTPKHPPPPSIPVLVPPPTAHPPPPTPPSPVTVASPPPPPVPSSGSTPPTTPSSPPTTMPPSGGSTPPNAPPTNIPPPSGGSTPPNAPPTATPPPTWYPPPPPSSEVSGGKRVRCKNRNYPQCYALEQSCPSACASTCQVDCVTCKPVCSCDHPGAVCQDPRFIGGDGITFYFHGKKNRDFCLVSDSNLHINAHFIGRRNANMRRDFTWVQSLGILYGSHNLFIGALKTSAWDDAVDRLSLYLDGAPITLPQHEGASWHSETTPRISFTRYRDTNAMEIEVEKNFKIKAMVVPITQKDSLIHSYGITNEDCFAHLDLSFKFYALSGDVSGVLGQTYARNYVSRAKMGVAMPVLGGEREFASSGLFTTDCAASRFIGHLAPRNSTESYEYADLECASGIEGRGVVCKR